MVFLIGNDIGTKKEVEQVQHIEGFQSAKVNKMSDGVLIRSSMLIYEQGESIFLNEVWNSTSKTILSRF